MKNKIYKGIGLFILGFLILFVFRFIYGYITYPAGGAALGLMNQTDSFDFGIRNYASSKWEGKGIQEGGFAVTSVDQKFEKVANISTQSTAFKAEEVQIRTLIKKHKALIQYEQLSGNPGFRRLQLAIGVNPARFDQMVEEVKLIGEITNIQINKSDKTNEYKELHAKKQSLEKTRTSLIDLKKLGGKIEELINLESRILEIENQIQALGVSLGDFDSENEFCTVKFTMREVAKAEPIPMMQRIKVAFEWTIMYYAAFLGIVALAAFISFLVVVVIDKGKQLYESARKG